MINIYNSARNIMDFYMEKLEEDLENSNVHFAVQYANLKLLKYRTSSLLDAIESYTIKVD